MRRAPSSAAHARTVAVLASLLAALCSAILAAGCHSLPDLGRCGNGIVEEANGEACDDEGDSPTCTPSCQLRCTPEAAKPSYVLVGTVGEGEGAHDVYCPGAQYQCGTDEICRAPSGFFETTGSPLAFDVGAAPVLGDSDNDGLLDLIGTSPTQIYTRFASTFGAPLGEVVVQDAPSSNAPYAIFDRDLGPRDPARFDMQIAIPTEGVALLRSDGERFAPELELPIALGVGPGAQLGLVASDPALTLGDVIISVAAQSPTPEIKLERVEVLSPDGTDHRVDQQALPSCTGPGTGAWRTLFIKGGPDRRSFVVVTQRDALGQQAPQPWHVCRYAHVAGSWARVELDFPAPAPSSVALANVDDDPCLELAVRIDTTAGLSMVDAAGSSCDLAAGLQPIPILDAGLGLGLLAAGQIIGADTDELALQGGLYQKCTGPQDCPAGASSGTYVRVIAPTKVPWHAATVVDLNGDSVPDVVAARGGEPDVDVIRGGPASANVYRASTSAPIQSLVAGDFDGDRVGDAAMIEATAGGDRIVVLFGARQGIVGTPIAMTGPIGRLLIDRVGRAPWYPSKRGADGVDDLFVLNIDPMTATARAGLLIGDAARIMTSPRFPTTAAVGTLLQGLIAGPLTNTSGNVEILALADMKALIYDVKMARWTGDLPIPAGLGPPVAALRDREGGVRGAMHGPNNNGSELVVVSARGMAITLCRIATAGAVGGMHPVDIDNDGVDEVAVQYGPGGRLVQVFRVTGGPTCALEQVLADQLENCIDLASAGGRLVALCRASNTAPADLVVPIERTADGQLVRSPEVARVQGDARFATAGDFDGDGVPDLAVGVRRIDTVGVQLLRQCPAHDTRTCVKPQPSP